MFIPKRIIFEKNVIQHPIAERILQKFQNHSDVEIIHLTNNRIADKIPGEDLYTRFREGKKTLIVDTKKSLTFQSCKPSAHYQLPLVTGCMGKCAYCYLHTRQDDKVWIRVHANLKEILQQTSDYITSRLPETTLFEGSATSDPIPVDPYTHALRDTIIFFGKQTRARFRFVTKYNDVTHLLEIPHHGHTEARFSINTDTVISDYEKGTASRNKRIEAAIQMAEAGYPIGFLIAPVFIYPNWRAEYTDMLHFLKERLPHSLSYPVTFEVISHRYTTAAKNRILQIFPETTLPMNEEARSFKYGQFGYGKYLYPKEVLTEIKQFFRQQIEQIFPHHELKYII